MGPGKIPASWLTTQTQKISYCPPVVLEIGGQSMKKNCNGIEFGIFFTRLPCKSWCHISSKICFAAKGIVRETWAPTLQSHEKVGIWAYQRFVYLYMAFYVYSVSSDPNLLHFFPQQCLISTSIRNKIWKKWQQLLIFYRNTILPLGFQDLNYFPILCFCFHRQTACVFFSKFFANCFFFNVLIRNSSRIILSEVGKWVSGSD